MDKLSYALGMSMASNLMNSGFRQLDVKSFVGTPYSTLIFDVELLENDLNEYMIFK